MTRIFCALVALFFGLCVYQHSAQAGFACLSYNGGSILPDPMEGRYVTTGTAPMCTSNPTRYAVVSTPFEYCAAYATWDPSLTAAQSRVCYVKKNSSSDTRVCFAAQSNNNCAKATGLFVPNRGGQPCFEATWSATPNGGLILPGANGCSPCVSPFVWDSASVTCKQPECSEGMVWDGAVNECRLLCDEYEGIFYHYSTKSCKPECPVGQNSVIGDKTNKRLSTQEGDEFKLSGCMVRAHMMCQPDTLNETGLSCLYWWEYIEEIPETIEMQIIYEEDSSGYYEGEQSSPEMNATMAERVAATEGEPMLLVDPSTGPIAIPQVYYKCQEGKHYAVMTINGSAVDFNMLGSCNQADDLPEGDYSHSDLANRIQDTKEAISDMAANQTAASGVLQQIGDGIAGLGDKIDALAASLGGGGGGDGEDPGEGEGDGDFEGPGTGDAYEREHDGVGDVIGSGDFGSTQLGQYLHGLIPDLGAGADECISWDLHAPFVGEFVFEPPCQLWNVLAAMVMAFAAFIAWSIVWRV
jgi:hypothetical protein